MSAKFFKSELRPMSDDELGIYLKGSTLSERIPDDGRCDDCGNKRWWLLPKESSIVQESGKQYIECLICGYQTHL